MYWTTISPLVIDYTATDILLILAFLFFMGSVLGWCLEVMFRRFFSAKKWINPGFLTGPYLPLYGFGVVTLFLMSAIPIDTGIPALNAVIIILIMGVAMTAIEYIAGLIFIKGLKIRLWDYSDRWGNIQGIICPLFSFFWLVIAAVFYFVIDDRVVDAVKWFVGHIEFAFVVGMFFGVFVIDIFHAFNISGKIRAYANEHNVVVSFEKLKETIHDKVIELGQKVAFMFPFKVRDSIKEQLLTVKEKFISRIKKKDDNKDKKEK